MSHALFPGMNHDPLKGEARQRHEPTRLLALDHPEQRVVAGRSTLPLQGRVDQTHELPIVVYDGGGREIARFANPADVAIFDIAMASVLARTLTLPAPLVESWAAMKTQRATAADLPAMLRNAGAQ